MIGLDTGRLTAYTTIMTNAFTREQDMLTNNEIVADYESGGWNAGIYNELRECVVYADAIHIHAQVTKAWLDSYDAARQMLAELDNNFNLIKK